MLIANLGGNYEFHSPSMQRKWEKKPTLRLMGVIRMIKYAVVPCLRSSLAGCALAVWTLAASAGTALQPVPEAANEEQKVPYRCSGGGGRLWRGQIHS